MTSPFHVFIISFILLLFLAVLDYALKIGLRWTCIYTSFLTWGKMHFEFFPFRSMLETELSEAVFTMQRFVPSCVSFCSIFHHEGTPGFQKVFPGSPLMVMWVMSWIYLCDTLRLPICMCWITLTIMKWNLLDNEIILLIAIEPDLQIFY